MQRWPATRTYYLREAVASLNSGLIFTSIWTFYYETLQLTLTQVSLIFVIIPVARILLEIPTGVVADTYSRRISIIIGGAFIGLCYTSAGLFPFYIVILLCALLQAIGDTLVSGALEAWITDEVGADNVGPVFLRSTQISTPMHWIGVLLSIGLAALFNYQIPIALGGVLWLLLTIVLIAKIPETHVIARKQTPHLSMREHLQSTGQTFRYGLEIIRNNTVVLQIIIASFFATALLDTFYRFSRLHFLDGFVLPTIKVPLLGVLKNNFWFGLFEVCQGILALVGVTILRRYVVGQHTRVFAGILTVFYTLMMIGVLLFAGTNTLLIAIGAWLIVNVLDDIGRPIVATWLNQTIDSVSRATILSINSQVNMVSILVLVNGMSVIGDLYGVRPTLFAASAFLLPIIALYFRNWRRETRLAASTLKPEV